MWCVVCVACCKCVCIFKNGSDLESLFFRVFHVFFLVFWSFLFSSVCFRHVAFLHFHVSSFFVFVMFFILFFSCFVSIFSGNVLGPMGGEEGCCFLFSLRCGVAVTLSRYCLAVWSSAASHGATVPVFSII